jgi:hypothetical protein
MQYFKRVVPFVLTFAAGLLIASLFGAAIAPNFGKGRESRRGKCRDRQELLMQIDNLRDELKDVKRENELLKRRATSDAFEPDWAPPAEIEHPPAPPKRPKQPRNSDVVQ